MNALVRPRHPLIDRALSDARDWCKGHVIDGQPAIVHAVRVAVTVANHERDAAPGQIAAALLHDSPDFAPPDIDLDHHLTGQYGADTCRLVRAIEADHQAINVDVLTPPREQDVLLLSTADRLVALTSAARRARRSDTRAFFTQRQRLVELLPYFQSCCDAAWGRVPATLTRDLAAVLAELRQLIVS